MKLETKDVAAHAVASLTSQSTKSSRESGSGMRVLKVYRARRMRSGVERWFSDALTAHQREILRERRLVNAPNATPMIQLHTMHPAEWFHRHLESGTQSKFPELRSNPT